LNVSRVSVNKDRLQKYIALRTFSCTKIQATWRMWKGKLIAFAKFLKKNRSLKHAAILEMPESCWSHQLLLQLGAVSKLCQFYRSSLLARGWLSASQIQRIHQAAITIQALIRGHLSRRNTRIYLDQLTYSCQVIERAWKRKMTWNTWKSVIMENQARKRLHDEEERAASVSLKMVNQFAQEELLRQEKFVIILQRMYRTFKHRQVYQKIANAKINLSKAQANAHLGQLLEKQTNSVVFQAEIWTTCLEQKRQRKGNNNVIVDPVPLTLEAALAYVPPPLTIEEECQALETTLEQLYNETLEECSMADKLERTQQELVFQNTYFETVCDKIPRATEDSGHILLPFAKQSQHLVLESTRVGQKSKRLQQEIIRLKKLLETFYTKTTERLSFDPLLYELDVERMLESLEPQWQPNSQHLYQVVMNRLGTY